PGRARRPDPDLGDAHPVLAGAPGRPRGLDHARRDPRLTRRRLPPPPPPGRSRADLCRRLARARRGDPRGAGRVAGHRRRAPGPGRIREGRRPVIDRDAVLHVARLARLELTDAEVERMTGELSKVLESIQKIGELDLEGVPPTSHVVEVS